MYNELTMNKVNICLIKQQKQSIT